MACGQNCRRIRACCHNLPFYLRRRKQSNVPGGAGGVGGTGATSRAGDCRADTALRRTQTLYHLFSIASSPSSPQRFRRETPAAGIPSGGRAPGSGGRGGRLRFAAVTLRGAACACRRAACRGRQPCLAAGGNCTAAWRAPSLSSRRLANLAAVSAFGLDCWTSWGAYGWHRTDAWGHAGRHATGSDLHI